MPFKDGKPQGYYQNFVTGFWVSGVHRAEVWGRPAALAVAKDGALLVADDTGGTIWRIAYTGAKPGGGGAPQPTTGAQRASGASAGFSLLVGEGVERRRSRAKTDESVHRLTADTRIALASICAIHPLPRGRTEAYAPQCLQKHAS